MQINKINKKYKKNNIQVWLKQDRVWFRVKQKRKGEIMDMGPKINKKYLFYTNSESLTIIHQNHQNSIVGHLVFNGGDDVGNGGGDDVPDETTSTDLLLLEVVVVVKWG